MKKKRRRAGASKPRKAGALMSALDDTRRASSDLRIRTLLHELQVHSEEITVQNEQLIKAQWELEQARDRYADLYDFAPIGYVSLDPEGTILEINLTGAALLGKQRRFLLNTPITGLVATPFREPVREFLERVRRDLGPPTVDVAIKADPERYLRLMARPRVHPSGQHELFTAMLDITEQRRLEEERQAAFEREQRKAVELSRENAVRLQAEDRIKAMLERIVTVQEQEKRRLALNLHDHLGQQLTALKLALDAWRSTMPGTDEAQQRFEFMVKIVTQLDADVDLLAWELRPAALDDVGLEAALHEFLRQWSAAQNFKVDFHASLGDGPRMPSDVESHLYRIVQEALNNVSKHAKAKHTSVLLERRGEEVRLIIEDDGRGFNIDAVRARRDGGMGLAGMQERAAAIGGELQLESAPGRGTTLFVRIPISVAPPRAKVRRKR
jgi:PAS domain S-box-containing protein